MKLFKIKYLLNVVSIKYVAAESYANAIVVFNSHFSSPRKIYEIAQVDEGYYHSEHKKEVKPIINEHI